MSAPHVELAVIQHRSTVVRAILLVDGKEEYHRDGPDAVTTILYFLSGYFNGRPFTFAIQPTVFVDGSGVVILAG